MERLFTVYSESYTNNEDFAQAVREAFDQGKTVRGVLLTEDQIDIIAGILNE